MFSDERRQKIIELLKESGYVQVADLAKHFIISEATIRRDLEHLKKAGLARRTYGGAAIIEGINSEIPLTVREEERVKEKEIIALLGARLIKEGDVLVVDSSSTCAKLIPHLHAKKPATVITNNPKTAIDLSKNNHIKVYCTGGHLRNSSLSFIGESARHMVSSFMVDWLFFSCRGASFTAGLTDPSEEEAELKRTMLANAKKRVVLLDSKKFDRNGFARICDFTSIDYLITDEKPKKEWRKFLEKHNILVIYPQK